MSTHLNISGLTWEAHPEIGNFVNTIPVTEKGNLACPFCGGVKLARLVSRRKPDVSWIECTRCGATGPNLDPEIGWNMRAFGEHVYVPAR